MNEEIFEKISGLLAKSGTIVSKKIDGTIVVLMPDSENKLAECTDNGDGTISYTMYLGDGTDKEGQGTPEEFREQVISALDSWIEYIPYDKFSVESNISPEYRRSIGESREDAIRNTLFEMGLDSLQADAIMEVARVLMEGSEVSAVVGGKELFGSSIPNLATRKENKNYLRRQWAMEQYKNQNKPWPGKTVLTDDALAAIGVATPTDAQLIDYVKGHMRDVDEHHFTKGDDEQYSGAVYSKFDTAEKGGAAKGGSKKKSSDDGSDAVMSGEGTFEIEGDNNLDEDVLAQETRHSDNEADKVYSSAEDASEQIGSQVSDVGAETEAPSNAAREQMIKKLNEMGYINGNMNELQNFQLEQCIYAVSKLVANNKFNPEKFKNASPEILLKAVGYKAGSTPSQQEIAESMMPSLWVGDASSLGGAELDGTGEEEIPVQYISSIEEAAGKLKADLFNNAHEVYEKVPEGTTMNAFIGMLMQRTPTRILLEALYGNPVKKTPGIVNQILAGDPQVMTKIANGEPLIDGSKMTPDVHGKISAALKTPVVSNTIRLIQDSFGMYIDTIVQQLPAGYAEVAEGDEGTYAGIPQKFVDLVRSIMLGKECPLAGYSWKAIDNLINNFASVATLSAPSGSRQVTGTITRKPVVAR